MSVSELIGVEKRLQQLCEGEEQLLACLGTDETDQGVYALTLRAWPHPEVDGATTVSLRYAYLTKGDGGDGWVGSDDDAAGINMRVPAGVDVYEFFQTMSAFFAASGARYQNGHSEPYTDDLLAEGE
jgi:hypothetical protein